MNAIKFRGKNKQRGWVYGSLVESKHSYRQSLHPHRYWIIDRAMSNGGWFTACRSFPVDESTVGQCTLAQDEVGMDIYEGDILEHRGERYVVRYLDKYARFALTKPGVVFAGVAFCCCRVIGNIHDNPELMGGE